MENILVVPAEKLRPFLAEKGLITGKTDEIIAIIRENLCFMPRDKAESDKAYKQIIPYAAIRRGGEIFVTRRTNKGYDTRLHGMLALGVGGHINEQDLAKNDRKSPNKCDILMTGLFREVEEEVSIGQYLETNVIGFINDDTNDVGSVHLGMFCVIDAAGEVTIRETEKLEGFWARPEELEKLDGGMETWSGIIIPALRDDCP